MKGPCLFFKISGLALAVLVIGTSANAQQITITKTAEETFNDRSREASALEPICDGRYLLVADDKKGPLLIVKSDTRQVVNESLAIPDPTPPKDPQSKPVFLSGVFDWEAMAKDSENNYYLVSSHDPNTTSRLLRFRLNQNSDPTKPEIVGVDEFFVKPLKELKPKLVKPQIEGLAVRETGGQKELIFGIREQWSDTIRVYSAVIKPPSKDLNLEPLFSFEPESAVNVPASAPSTIRWHLSSIDYVPNLGFLILTSTETEKGNVFYGNALWFVSDTMLETTKPRDGFKSVKPSWSAVFDSSMKAEGLSVLSSADKEKIRAVIVFDNDAKIKPNEGRIRFVDITLETKTP